jgi:protein TonB
VPGGVPGGVLGGVIGGVLGSTGPVTAPAPPPPSSPKVEETPAKPVRVTTGVLKGIAIRRVMPDYPLIARNARLQGHVDVNVVVDEQGNVIAAEVVSGHPLLREAALRAASQWKFRPTLVSGQPVKVTGVLTFIFQLSKEGGAG